MDYSQFTEKIYKMTTIDLDKYKERQMKRRIDTLIDKTGYDGYDSFIVGLQNDPKLYETFINYLTINVSEFFRNKEQWDNLNNTVYPYLFDTFSKKPVIWSAACSTGEEPYSLVMSLAEFIPLSNIHIIATDIDKQVLAKAKDGIYTEKSIKSVPEKYLKKYFTKIDSYSYKINDEIKKCVEFKQHNLLKDPYPMECDMIVCRNVLIYFTEEAKHDIFVKFNKSLKKAGVLFVGSTEQIIKPKEIGYSVWKSFFYKKE